MEIKPILKQLDLHQNIIKTPTQTDSDSVKSGDGGDVSRKLSLACYYCNYQGKSNDEILSHSVNRHTGKPARPDPSLLNLLKPQQQES